MYSIFTSDCGTEIAQKSHREGDFRYRFAALARGERPAQGAPQETPAAQPAPAEAPAEPPQEPQPPRGPIPQVSLASARKRIPLLGMRPSFCHQRPWRQLAAPFVSPPKST